jgi:uncharacterized membrane protein YgcG
MLDIYFWVFGTIGVIAVLLFLRYIVNEHRARKQERELEAILARAVERDEKRRAAASSMRRQQSLYHHAPQHKTPAPLANTQPSRLHRVDEDPVPSVYVPVYVAPAPVPAPTPYSSGGGGDFAGGGGGSSWSSDSGGSSSSDSSSSASSD